MEPKDPQLTPDSRGEPPISDSITMMFAKPEPTTLADLKVDSVTGNYRGTKPGGAGKEVDTKAEIAQIREDKAKDAEKSAAAKKMINDNSAEIEKMRKSTPASRYYEKVLQKSTEQRQKRLKYRGK